MGDIFDKSANEYSSIIDGAIKFSNKEQSFFTSIKSQILLKVINAIMPAEEAAVLDVGCGVGLIHSHLAPPLKGLEGIDTSEVSIKHARETHPDIKYRVYNGRELPHDDSQFDFAFSICVMHHVPPNDWQSFLNEMRRVLKPGGTAIIIEHNPLNPATQYVTRNCDLDKDAVLLNSWRCRKELTRAGFRQCSTDYFMFFPFENTFFRKIEAALRWLPLGAQYICIAEA